MFPCIDSETPEGCGLPRSRGDVPLSIIGFMIESMSAPLTRGCSRSRYFRRAHCYVCPAHAGMFPMTNPATASMACLPRSRGDVPQQREASDVVVQSAPLTRGCSLSQEHDAPLACVCPAHAGMFPPSHPSRPKTLSLPRSRGDVPPWDARGKPRGLSAPLTRGCSASTAAPAITLNVCPAHAGMFLR